MTPPSHPVQRPSITAAPPVAPLLSYLDVAEEVRAAVQRGGAVVALESTVLAHGLPWPENLEVARTMEARIREQGAVPATIAVMDGAIRVGLRAAELEQQAWQLAGATFNLGSPKQLQEIFYERLQLPVLQRTPTGQPSSARIGKQAIHS